MNRFYTRLIRNKVFANVILLSIIVLAIAASFTMIRETSPEIFIPIIEVDVAYPGADPEEVESSISSRIDGAIEGIQGTQLVYIARKNQLVPRFDISAGRHR